MTKDFKSESVHRFLRALNIVLKSARMYGFEHIRTGAQFDAAWSGLQAALAVMGEAGLQLAVSEGKLLLDGVPLKAGPIERSFAELLSTADLASLTFTPWVTPNSLQCFVRVLADAGVRPAGLAELLKAALSGDAAASIRINEVRYVPADSDRPEAKSAAALVGQSLGVEAERLQEWLNDPNKLLQLIAAAEGSRSAESTGAPDGQVPAALSKEEDFVAVLRLLGNLAQGAGKPGAFLDPGWLKQELCRQPETAQTTVKQALAQFAAAAPTTQVDRPLLLRLAQHLAVRFALERYERGDVRVDAISELFDRLNREIEILRKTLGTYEDKMKSMGLAVEAPAEILERQFWSELTASAKLEALLSPAAWRVPSCSLRQHVEELLQDRDTEKLQNVLLNYVRCIQSPEPEARRNVAVGVKGLAEHYALPAGQPQDPLHTAIGLVGDQLIRETDLELQNQIGACFVRLIQEAAARRRYVALLQAVACLKDVERRQPDLATRMRERMGLGNRIPDFLEEALRVAVIPEELVELLRNMPTVAVEHMAGRLSRCSRRRERDRLVELSARLGSDAAGRLRETLRSGPPASAVCSVGLLSRLDLPALEEFLRARLSEWNRTYHFAVVRQIAAAGAPERGRLLAKLFNFLEPLVLPLVVDEMGMSGDAATGPVLLALAGAELPRFASPYLRVKAIEALGRLREKAAVPLLRRLIEAKEGWRWVHPQELRVVAAQALLKIDPEATKAVVRNSNLAADDLALGALDRVGETPGVRQRYYQRFRLPTPFEARINSVEGHWLVTILVLSLGGGLARGEHQVSAGAAATIKIQSGLRSVGAQIVLCDSRPEHLAFGIVEMGLEDRTKLRSLLKGIQLRTA